MNSSTLTLVFGVLASTAVSGCGTYSGKNKGKGGLDAMPHSAQQASIDRFSDKAGHLQRRSQQPSLPAANAPVNFDQGPFVTLGLAANGQHVQYYNFDVQATTSAPIYVLFKTGASTPVEGQLNLVDVIPGDDGYSDFWQVIKVTVPDDYEPNSITSVADLRAAGYPTAATPMLVNCPIVPAGSTATQRYAGSTDTGLHQGWYRGMTVNYFNFFEKALTLTSSGQVPVSPILVAFNKNPDPSDPTSGPESGFRSEPGSLQTHNVVGTVPEDAGYSPLWNVSIYDNAAFSTVHDLRSAAAATLLARGVADVNCPIFARQ